MTKPQWIVQDSFVPYNFSISTSSTLDEIDCDYVGMGVIPFTNSITGLDDLDMSKPCVVRGSTKVLKNLYLQNENLDTPLFNYLRTGTFYDLKAFDQSFYNNIDLPLFNKDCDIVKFSDLESYAPDCDYFVKPSMDMKFFCGLTGLAGDILKTSISKSNMCIDEDVNPDFNIIVSRLRRPPTEEYRAFCVCGEITSISRYYKDGTLSKSDVVSDYIIDAVKEFIKVYSPHDVSQLTFAFLTSVLKLWSIIAGMFLDFTRKN